jgi:MFS family permease
MDGHRHGPRPPGGDAGFVRDAPTLLSYGAVAAYAFWLYAFGPALTLLRAELHFSYTVIGVYSALWSGGAALAGVCFAALARRFGRHATLWLAAVGASAGAVLFAAARTVTPGLLAAGLLGFAGTTVLMVTQSVLADRHGQHRDRALTEANAGAAGCAVLAPLALGALAPVPVGWRLALAVPALALAALYFGNGRQPLSAPPPAGSTGHGRGTLSLAYWLLALLVAIGIAIEFCLVYFAAEHLHTVGLSTTAASTAVSALYLGILAGRLAGARLTRIPYRNVALLWVSFALTTAGFLPFWLADQPLTATAGLFVCGIGIANLYPLSLALALASAPQRTDAANARTQLLGGLAVIAAPYLLGSLADHLGLTAAFAVEPALIIAAALLLLAGLRTGKCRWGTAARFGNTTSNACESKHA